MYYADDLLVSSGNKNNNKGIGFNDTMAGTLVGALVGLTGGTLFAYFENKDYLKSIIIGTISVGIISRVALIKNN